MDFAPYQSSPPEHARSPTHSTTASPRTSLDTNRRAGAYSPATGYHYQHRQATISPPPLQHPQPQRAWSGEGVGRYQSPLAAPGNATSAADLNGSAGGDGNAGSGGSPWGGRGGGMGDYFSSLGAREGMVSEFDTSLGLRLDYEACLAYLVAPPLGAILLLILERKSDYVRYVWLLILTAGS